MESSYPNKVLQFCVARGKYVLLRRVCNTLVYWHVRTTPRASTPDTLNDIIQEQLRQRVRAIEQQCHTLQQRYTQLGKELLHDDDGREQSTTRRPDQQDREGEEAPDTGEHAI